MPFQIWVDADALPRAIVDVIVRTSLRRDVHFTLVSNQWRQPANSAWVEQIVVPQGPDIADDYIAERCGPGELVLTADIPLSARAVEAGAIVLDFRGERLTAKNVRERLSMRDFMEELRQSGVETGGPKPFSPKDKQRFSNGLDRELARARVPARPKP